MCPPPAAPVFDRRLDFPPGTRSRVAWGLAFTRQTLTQWRPDPAPAAVDDVLLVVAEILTNAADHATGPLALHLHLDPHAGRLRIEVTDTSQAPPQLRPARPGEPHGRGMRIIDRLATAWGSRPEGDGKTVWAVLRFPAQ